MNADQCEHAHNPSSAGMIQSVAENVQDSMCNMINELCMTFTTMCVKCESF